MGMNMVRCTKCGGFYNSNASDECPYCLGSDTGKISGDMTEVVEREHVREESPSAPSNEKVSVFPAPSSEVSSGCDPVVGWLVAISGSMKGRSFTLRSENNYIGRSSKMDVCLAADENVADTNNAFVTYDSRDKVFYLTPGEVRNIVRLNGSPVLQSVIMASYDRIEIGSTELLFIPLCGEDFDWDSDTE